MAFMKVADAKVIHPRISRTEWKNIRTAGKQSGSGLNPALLVKTSEVLGEDFNPKDYLLTHATIVASVDVFSPQGIKTGSQLENGFRVNRKFSDFRVTPETSKYINNNFDAWSRGVLGKSFSTFIGGHNFVEHVQQENLSKGRIIDAVARDVGESLYIDILIATHRKHSSLVKAIESGAMGTLSMGCFLPGTHVTMADGRRLPIEDVAPGDMVLTHKGRSREVLNKQIRGGKWDMRTVHAVGLASPVTSTGNHPYYVLRPADVCACGCGEELPPYKPRTSGTSTTRALSRRFKVGHDKRILNPNNTYSLDEHRRRKATMDEIKAPELVKVRADELRVGDFVAFPRVKDGAHTVVTTEGKARLLGYFLAEGSFLKHKGKHVGVQFDFSLTEKDSFVAEVVQLLTQEFPGTKPWVQDRLERTTSTVHATGTDMVAWFLQHGGEYSHAKHMSPEVMNWSNENHKHLIGTWLNGDGHMAKAHGGFLAGTTVSLDLACQMHALMAKCGLFARFEARIGSKSVSVAEAVNGGIAVRDEVTGRLPAYLLTLGNTQSVELHGYCAKAPSTSKYSVQNNRTFEDWVVSPITAIEESTYEGWVHDMEVEEDHTYIAEGASVSNCTVDGTQCTKCGHWAADETEMCSHIKYEKGNVFYDDQGVQHRVAELCGHESLDGTGGVTFIEASWVETPAFTGAVLRNVVSPTQDVAKKTQQILATLPPQWDHTSMARAAKLYMAEEWAPEGEGEAAPAEAPPAAPPDPLKDVEDQLYKVMLDRVVNRVRKDVGGQGPAPTRGPSESTNENLNKQSASKRIYEAGLDVLIKTASSDVALLNGLADYNKQVGIEIPIEIYRVALRVGNPHHHGSVAAYRKACQIALGRNPAKSEAQVLLKLGQMIFKRAALKIS